MKRSLQNGLALMLLITISCFTMAQQGVGNWGGGFSGVPLCESSDDETVPFQFYGTALTAGSEIRWLKKDASGNWVDDGLVMNISPASGTVNEINLNVTFTGAASGNNVFVSVTSASPGTVSASSAQLTKPEGQCAMRIVNGGTTTFINGNTLYFWRGLEAEMELAGTASRTDRIVDVQVLRECVTDIMLKNTNNCQYSDMDLTIVEVEQFIPGSWPFMAVKSGGFNPGSVALSTSEANAVNGSTGLDLFSFLPSSPGGRHFRVTLTVNTFGGSKHTTMRLHVKDELFDLRMRDNLTQDNGAEPFYAHATDVFESPDIWNRSEDTSTPGTHENPDYISIPGNTNRLMFFVENIGCGTSPADQAVRLFWTRARSPEPWEIHWTAISSNTVTSAMGGGSVFSGSEITISGATMGSPHNTNTDPYLLPAIIASGTHSDGVEWYPPNPDDFDITNGQMHNALQRPIICLLARINEPDSTHDSIVFEPDTVPIRPYVKNNNNVVTRNTTLVDDKQFLVKPGDGTWNWGYNTIGVGHDSYTEEDVTVDICLEQLPGGHTADYLDYGMIEVATSAGLYTIWDDGGSQSTNMSEIQSTQFSLTANSGCLENMTLSPGTEEALGVRFHGDETNLPSDPQRYRFRLYTLYSDGSPGMSCILNVGYPTAPPEFGDPKTRPEAAAVESIDRVRIFPNPADEVLHLFYPAMETETTTSFDLEVSNMAGQIVMSREAMNRNVQHNLSIKDLEAGVYLISLRVGDEVSTHRIVIE